MDPYIKGVVLKNEVGAEYEGKVWDRWLTLKLSDGQNLIVFDNCLISTDLQVGATHIFLLKAICIWDCILASHQDDLSHRVKLTNTRTNKPLSKSRYQNHREWTGQIIETSWQPPNILGLFSPYLAQIDAVLVSTSVGGVLLSPAELPENYSIGALC